jgi:hypothetical protein
MASSINPNNIDTTYPVAGQDNDSQGFRDNFTNLKTNFTYTKSEIEDLQSKVVLKSALSGTTLDNDFAGAVITAAKMTDMRLTKTAKGTVSGTVTLDFEEGGYQTVTTAGNITLAFSNFPASGAFAAMRVSVTVASTAHTVTLPAAVSVGTGGVAGFDGTDTITFPDAGTFDFEFSSDDGGSTITLVDLNRPLETIRLNASEVSSGAISLTESASYFDTGASGETSTLAAGAEGQVKMLAMTSDGGGNMVVTVTNAAWGSTITLADVGDGCTLLYTNSKWVCVGNNGCAFA